LFNEVVVVVVVVVVGYLRADCCAGLKSGGEQVNPDSLGQQPLPARAYLATPKYPLLSRDLTGAVSGKGERAYLEQA